jgi:hypothetical protein
MGNSCLVPDRNFRICGHFGPNPYIGRQIARELWYDLEIFREPRPSSREKAPPFFLDQHRRTPQAEVRAVCGDDENTGTTSVSKGRLPVLPFLNLLSRPCV